MLWLVDDWMRQPLQLLPAGSDSIVTLPVAEQHIPSKLLIWSPIGALMDESALAGEKSVSYATGDLLIGPNRSPLDAGELMHRMVVAPSYRFFNVEIRTDREAYAPGDSIALFVRTTDGRGFPVEAAVTVQGVDEAVYGFEPDHIDLRQHFYRLLATTDGIGGCGVWKPPLPLPPILASLHPTAFWFPKLRTHATNGRAVIRTKLPDEVARWRITVRAVDRRGRLAETKAHLMTISPLSVRSGLPRFARAGDLFDFSVWADNTTRRPLEVDLSWQIAGDSMSVSPSRAHVRAEPGRSAMASFTLAAHRSVEIPPNLTAQAGRLRYRVGPEFHVLDPTTEMASARREPIDITLTSLLGGVRERLFDPEARTYRAWDAENLRAHLALADGYSLLAQQDRWDGLIPEPSPPDNSCGNPAFWAAETLFRHHFSSYMASNAARLAVDWEAGANRGWPIGSQRERERILDWMQTNAGDPEIDPDTRVEMLQAMMQAGLDPGLALEQAWTARDSLSPGSCARLALCLGAARPEDATVLIEKAVATALVAADTTVASYDPWSIPHAQTLSEGTQAAALVLQALTTLHLEHPLKQAFANGIALQCVADPQREWEPIGDLLSALVAYAQVGGAEIDLGSSPADDSTTATNELVARISPDIIHVSRSVSVHSPTHADARAATSGRIVEASGGHVHCTMGDTLVVELAVKAALFLNNASVRDPVAAGCGTLPPKAGRFYESEIWHEAAVEIVLPMLRPGKNEFVHRVVAERPGEFQVPPAQVILTHFPELTANSDPMTVTIAAR
jgi:hypothetical protein